MAILTLCGHSHLMSALHVHSLLASTSHGHSHLTSTLCGAQGACEVTFGVCISSCPLHHTKSPCMDILTMHPPHVGILTSLPPCMGILTSHPPHVGHEVTLGGGGVLSCPLHHTKSPLSFPMFISISLHVNLMCSPPCKNNIFGLVWKNSQKSRTSIPSIRYLLRATNNLKYEPKEIRHVFGGFFLHLFF